MKSVLKVCIILVDYIIFSVKSLFCCPSLINSVKYSLNKKKIYIYCSRRKLNCITSTQYDNLAELRQKLTGVAVDEP